MHLFSSPCTTQAHQSAADSSPAQSARAPGRCTNRAEWLHIAAFLDEFPMRPLEFHARSVGRLASSGDAAPGKRSAGAAAAGLSSIPDGNHGDNRTSA